MYQKRDTGSNPASPMKGFLSWERATLLLYNRPNEPPMKLKFYCTFTYTKVSGENTHRIRKINIMGTTRDVFYVCRVSKTQPNFLKKSLKIFQVSLCRFSKTTKNTPKRSKPKSILPFLVLNNIKLFELQNQTDP